MIKIAICDDEEYYLDKIENLVFQYFENNKIEIDVVTYTLPQNLLSSDIDKLDLIFLDVEMGDCNGISVGKKIRDTNVDAIIIYISSFQSYAIMGYKVKARAFLLKENLELSFRDCMKDILKELNKSKTYLDINNDTENINLPYKNILFVESFGRKVNVNTIFWSKPNYEIYGKISDIEVKLSQFGFLRVHRSYIVNMEFINRIYKSETNLVGGQTIKVSADNYMEIKRKFLLLKGS